MTTSIRKLLLVDDNVLLRDVMADALEDQGFTVLTATDGPDAIRVLGDDAHVDVMLTDVHMPNGMSGVDLSVRVHALHPEIRIVVVSGYPTEQLPPIPEYARFLPKPFRVADLLECLGEDFGASVPE